MKIFSWISEKKYLEKCADFKAPENTCYTVLKIFVQNNGLQNVSSFLKSGKPDVKRSKWMSVQQETPTFEGGLRFCRSPTYVSESSLGYHFWMGASVISRHTTQSKKCRQNNFQNDEKRHFLEEIPLKSLLSNFSAIYVISVMLYFL